VGAACSTIYSLKVQSEKTKEKDNLEDMGVNRSIILKQTH
jgi:hypothetical protein